MINPAKRLAGQIGLTSARLTHEDYMNAQHAVNRAIRLGYSEGTVKVLQHGASSLRQQYEEICEANRALLHSVK